MRSFETFYSFSEPLPHRLELGTGEVHVVRLNIEELRPFLRELYGILSGDERNRASLYRYPKDGDGFILVRGALRLMLARYLECHPQEIRFNYNSQGKPSLAAPHEKTSLEFNISFSGAIAIFGFSQGIALGIDVEQRDSKLDFKSVKERFLEQHDSHFLEGLPETLRRDGFFALWTLREAAAKAEGEGIFLKATTRPLTMDRWTAFSLFPGAGYSATLVMEQPGERVTFWSWSNEAVGLSHGPFAFVQESHR